jgi:hypothetical protein
MGCREIITAADCGQAVEFGVERGVGEEAPIGIWVLGNPGSTGPSSLRGAETTNQVPV